MYNVLNDIKTLYNLGYERRAGVDDGQSFPNSSKAKEKLMWKFKAKVNNYRILPLYYLGYKAIVIEASVVLCKSERSVDVSAGAPSSLATSCSHSSNSPTLKIHR